MTIRAKHRIMLIVVGLSLTLFSACCRKEVPVPPPPPPPPPAAAPAPSASISAEPSSIENGRSSTLRWSSTNAVSAELNQGIGTVNSQGSREVFPTRTTEYTLSVQNSDGKMASASATVTVREPPPPPPPPAPKPDLSEAFSSSNIQDAMFDYDKSDIRPDAAAVLRGNATALQALISEYSQASFLIEGHCDERGTTEYNLALGDRRSSVSMDFLMNLGVPASKLSNVSLGEESPVCSEADETCYQRNRRAHVRLR